MTETANRMLTDLEGAVLASIVRQGSATAYSVTREFSESPSEFFSGSAGAVYPLFKRLEGRGFVTGNAGMTGRRAHTDYTVTSLGHTAMLAWLLDVERGAAFGFDPLRTRLIFLELVDTSIASKYVADVEARINEHLTAPPVFARAETQQIHQSWLSGRINWLKQLRALFR